MLLGYLGRGNQSKAKISTDQYRPPVREAPPKDVPFIFKGSEEFPAEG